jgi:hypothetical protein
MKKVLMSIVAVLFAANSFAQTNSGGFSLSESTVYYGARIGMNISTITGDGTSDFKSKAGLTLGGVLGLRISDATPLFLESGLYFTQYGANAKDGLDDKSYININYLEIPVLIKYGFQVTDEISVLPYLGPTIALGITAKGKYPDTTGGYSTETGFKDNNLNRANVGIKVGCGAEYNMLYLELAYQLGVANISKADDLTAHGHAITLNFGVNF